MAVPKIILFDSPSKRNKSGTFPVCLRITHQRKRKYFFLGLNADPKQWNKETSRFRKNYPEHTLENKLLIKQFREAGKISTAYLYNTALNVLMEFSILSGKHSYATILKKGGAEVAKISEALSHGSELITQIYLKSFENSELDELDENSHNHETNSDTPHYLAHTCRRGFASK